jgi:queuine tRNA-ribosyltransferase
MPVATQGSVKALDPDDLRSIGARILLGNAYHLYLRPGVDIIEGLGGLHGFMQWDGPILTDSGGFQGFSLEHLREVTEDAIVFKSHIDGSIHEFTPEAAVHHQEHLGADIIMPLDMCMPAGAEKPSVEEALERTNRWAVRCKEAHSRAGQALFGIVQGGLFPDLRQRSAEYLMSLEFPGYGIGGLSVGESKDEMYTTLDVTMPLLPPGAPRHLLGVGSPEDIVEAVARGIDMFDCVLPTRIARNSTLIVRSGRVNVDTAPFRDRDGPVEEGCDCYTCRTFSAAYLHHLFRAKELLAYRLATIHNLRSILRLMEEIRESIIDGSFEAYRAEFHQRFTPPDEGTRREQKQRWLQSQGRPGSRVDKP